MKKFENIFSPLSTFIYLLVYSALILDSYKNPQKFEHFTFIGPEFLLLLALAINILGRLNKFPNLPNVFLNLNRFLSFPLFAVLSIALSVWTYASPPNYVYSLIPFNVEPILLCAILAGLIILINAKPSFIKHNLHQIIFLAPFVILLLGFLVALWPDDFFVGINKEDHFVENTQFLFLGLGVLFSAALSQKFWRTKQKLMTGVYLIVTFGLFVIAGEEISWGQRIFGAVTPEYIANQNSQGEINIHNLNSIVRSVTYGYMAIGLYGFFSWLLFKITWIKDLKYSRYFIIPWFEAFYFLPIFIYNLLLPPTKPHGLGEWSEMTELLMYSGILVFVSKNLWQQKRSD